MVTYTRFLLYTVLSLSYGQVKLQDIHLTCPESNLFDGTQINLTCTVSTNYPSKCASPVHEAEFRVSYDENAYTPLCKIMDVSQCNFNPNSEGCGCVENNNTHYTLKYTFIGSESHNITWDCLINCLDDSLNPALTFESKFCKRRNVERIPEHTTAESNDANGNPWKYAAIALGVGICVVCALAVVYKICGQSLPNFLIGRKLVTNQDKVLEPVVHYKNATAEDGSDIYDEIIENAEVTSMKLRELKESEFEFEQVEENIDLDWLWTEIEIKSFTLGTEIDARGIVTKGITDSALSMYCVPNGIGSAVTSVVDTVTGFTNEIVSVSHEKVSEEVDDSVGDCQSLKSR